ERGQYIVDRILAGEDCAIVSDAGMPCISDPGEDLVRICAEQNVTVTVIPGPSAVISALALSGLKTSRFTFEGFLSTNKTNRVNHLKSLKAEERTMIFYEAPHKLSSTLKDMLAVLGDRQISIAREITKVYEQVIRFTLSQAVEHYQTTPPRGEFVLVISGCEPTEEEQVTFEQVVSMAQAMVAEGQKATEVSKELAKAYGFKKTEIYKELL
ncbi:MAG: 16S rRNA (cytidine(1402)-2'-O)-methyltransferase, partial [Oscillospiraceae bacterium]